MPETPFQILAFTLFLAISLHVYPQDHQPLQFETIYTDEGLDFPVIRETTQDADGYIWFGSGGGGLYRYDGAGMTKFYHKANDPKTITSNTITSFLVDNKNRLWVGTTSGLNLYNNRLESFMRFAPNANHPLKYSQNVIHEIMQDSDGDIWIGTAGGLCKYIEEGDTNFFQHYYISNNPHDSALYTVRAMAEYTPGNLLIGTEHGLFGYHKKTNRFEPIDFEFTKDSFIYTILIDHSGKALIGTSNGLFRFSIDSLPHIKDIEAYYNNQMSEVKGNFSDNRINNLQIGKDGVLWVGSMRGLNVLFLPELTGVNHAYTVSYTANPCDKQSLTSNSINDIYIDREGTAWIGTSEGVSKNIKRKYRFLSYPSVDDPKSSVGNIEARSIMEDKNGSLWIANYTRGVTIFDKASKKYIQFPANIFNCLTNYCVLPDDNNIVWLAGYDDEAGGLYAMILPRDFFNTYNFDQIRFRRFYFEDRTRKPGNINFGKWVFKDSKGVIWFLTREGGVCRFVFKGDPRTSEPEIKQYWENNSDQYGMPANNTSQIIEDHKGNIWIGTRGNGFGRYLENEDRFEWYSLTEGDHRPNHNGILSLFEDDEGYIWLATNGGGVNRFDPETKQFQFFTHKEGLRSNTIMGIVNDDKGNIWLSSADGISLIERDLKTIQNFDLYDGLRGSYNARAAIRTTNNELIFGGNKGLIEVHENTLPYQDSIEANIVFTQLTIKGQEIQPTNPNQNYIDLSINQTETLTLTHHDFPVSIKFTLLSYANPRKNKYTYMMYGQSKQWIELDAAYPQITFNYLKGGEYILKIKGSNPDEVWSDVKSLKIIVKPPFYLTIWFIGLIVLIIVFIITSVVLFRIRFFREQTRQLNYLVDEKTSKLQLANEQILEQNETLAKQRDELITSNATKDKLFSIIAHDLRGPFGNVMNLAEMLTEQTESNLPRERLKELAYYIFKGTLEVDTLLGNLMEWSRSQGKKLKYTPSEVVLEDIIRFVFDLFHSTAKEKNNQLNYQINGKPTAIADSDMLTTIIRNLVNNALKYTDQGEITIICTNKSKLVIEVIDTGIGMSDDIKANVFDIAQKKTSRGTLGEKGTGLGLLLVKEFVEFHNGIIYIESVEKQGTKITLHIPQNS